MQTVHRILECMAARGMKAVDLAAELGVSKAVVSEWKAGRSRPDRHIARLSEILGVSSDYLLCKSDAPSPGRMRAEEWIRDNAYPQDGGFLQVPVYGTVRAGTGGLALEEFDSYEFLLRDTLHGEARDHFFLRVQGDSMEPEIREGDLALVHKQESVDIGALAVVIVDNEEGVIKRVHHSGPFAQDGVPESHWIELRSVNPYYPPRKFVGEEVLRVFVVGRVVQCTRRY